MISSCLYLGLTFGPLIIYNRCFTLFFLVICSGSSETKVFDEKSPSGNDYLAEVLIILPSPVMHDSISVKLGQIEKYAQINFTWHYIFQ